MFSPNGFCALQTGLFQHMFIFSCFIRIDLSEVGILCIVFEWLLFQFGICVICIAYFFSTYGFVSVWWYGTVCAFSRRALGILSSIKWIRLCFRNALRFSDG